MNSPMRADEGTTDLASIVCTAELQRRPPHPPDHAAESRVMVALMECLSQSPERVLETLAGAALELCQAQSSGISLLAPDGDSFFWPAVCGQWSAHVGGGTPRAFGPCGTVLDRDAAVLFSHPERHFSYLDTVTPGIEEALLLPFHVGGKAVGTIWVIAHDASRRFDLEDLRVMTALGAFASAAYYTLTAMDAIAARVASDRALADRVALDRERDGWLRSLITAQEDERRRVARELHDEMGQHVTSLMLGLELLRTGAVPHYGASIAKLQSIVTDLDGSVRRLARDLRPVALDDMGLIPALANHVEEWSQQTGITADFSSRHSDRRLPPPIESTLYRIAQEALTNVARHAQARHASVVVECRADEVVVIVDDDGHGFEAGEPTGSPRAGHFGLIGIRERAAVLGGRTLIESGAGGTSVFVALPLSPETPGPA